jgi:hypothetical protein
MRESAEFLNSLQHSNPNRPRFTIQPDEFETMLEIEHRGQRIEIPISEVLSFAARWEADREKQLAADPTPRLRVHPYPLYSASLSDPDMGGWW